MFAAPGDMLGIERYNGARSCLSSARSESDVVLYGFPAEAFDECILKYPHAVEYVAAEGRVTPDYQPAFPRAGCTGLSPRRHRAANAAGMLPALSARR